MKQLVQNPYLAAGLMAPCALVLIALEAVHVIPSRRGPRLAWVRRSLWVLSALCLAALGVLIVLRFSELKVQ